MYKIRVENSHKNVDEKEANGIANLLRLRRSKQDVECLERETELLK